VVQRLQAGTIILSKSTHFRQKWGLADIRKPDDGLRENVPVWDVSDDSLSWMVF